MDHAVHVCVCVCVRVCTCGVFVIAGHLGTVQGIVPRTYILATDGGSPCFDVIVRFTKQGQSVFDIDPLLLVINHQW